MLRKKILSLLLCNCFSIFTITTVSVFTIPTMQVRAYVPVINDIHKAIGPIDYYNAIVFGNYSAHNGESEGAIAIKGNFSLTTNTGGYTIGDKGHARAGQHYPAFVVGGSLSKDLNVGFNFDSSQTAMPVPVINETSTDIREEWARNAYAAIRFPQDQIYSAFDGFQEICNNTMNKVGEIFNNQSTNNGNKFNISDFNSRIKVANVNTPSELLNNNALNLPDLQNSDFLIIRCNAQNVSLGGGTFYNGQMLSPYSPIHGEIDSKILWVFPNATNINLNNVEFCGSILAPNATLSQVGGSINGQMVVRNYTNNQGAELHPFMFKWSDFLSIETPKQVEELKPVEEPKLVQESKPVEEPKPIDKPQPMQIPKIIERPELIEELKLVEGIKPIEGTRLVEPPKLIEESKLVQEPKPVHELKLIEQTGEIEAPRLIKAPRLIEEPEVIGELKSAEELKPIEGTRLVEPPRLIKAPRLIEEPEVIGELKSVEELKPIEGTRLVEPPKLIRVSDGFTSELAINLHNHIPNRLKFSEGKVIEPSVEVNSKLTKPEVPSIFSGENPVKTYKDSNSNIKKLDTKDVESDNPKTSDKGIALNILSMILGISGLFLFKKR